MKTIDKRTWEEFRSTKMLWIANRILHLFGWAICVEIDESGNAIDAFPARVKFRGFDEKSESEGFIGVAKYLENNAKLLREEAEL